MENNLQDSSSNNYEDSQVESLSNAEQNLKIIPDD